ncbi:MAG TPA: tetratricopeptide repeat protein [Chthoniobacterales bacterium]
MTHRLAFLSVLFCAIAVSASADKKDKFVVNTRFSHDAVVYLNRGTEQLEKGNTQAARQNYEAAIKVDPKIWPAYLNLAQILAHEGKWEQALQDCNIAMKLRPGFFRTSILRANVNQHLGRDKDSLSDLNLVISLHADDETDALALSQRAWLHVLSANPAVHDPKAALADAQLSCRLNHWRKANYIDALAGAEAETGDFEDAVRYEEQAIKSGKLSDEELKGAQSRLARYSSHERAPR